MNSAATLQGSQRARRPSVRIDRHGSRDELDFLAPALRIARTPAHPLPRVAAAALLALLACALAWACLGEVDVVASAPGRILANERSKTVQAPERGVVHRILVRDGDQVRSGQTLLVLDATAAQADQAIARDQHQQAQADRVRAQALLRALHAGEPWTPSPKFDGDGASGPDPLLRTEWQQIVGRHARLQAEVQRREAEVATAHQAVAKLEAALPLSRQREDDILSLARQGFVASHAGQDRSRERLELERDLALQRARLQEVLAGLAEAQVGRDAHLSETRHSLNERESQARLRAAASSHELTKAAQRSRLMRLSAPVGGTVQQLAVHTVGGVVTEAQALMVIVPEGTDPSGLAAEVELDSRDIGFVSQGQLARVKLETFPYTRYGSLDARVDFVGADAVRTEGGRVMFPVRLRLSTAQIEVEGKTLSLSAGMVLTAELHTGRRRIIDYLLGPLQRARAESLRER